MLDVRRLMLHYTLIYVIIYMKGRVHMNTVWRQTYEISFDDGQTWYQLRKPCHSYSNKPRSQQVILCTFDAACEFIKQHDFPALTIKKAIFSNKSVIVFRSGELWTRSSLKYTEKTFVFICVRAVNKNVTLTISEMANYLPADDFCRYLNDHKMVYRI